MNTNERYDVIVIGGGPNGLIAGAYLAKAGAKVLLIERRHETGGGLMTEIFSGFLFNLHAVYMFMTDVMPPYTDLNLEKYGAPYMRPKAQVSLLTKDGKALTLYSDVEKSVKSIEKFSTKDAARFREVWRECEQLANDCLIPATYTFPMGPMDQVALFSETETGRRLLEYAEKTPLEIMDEWGFTDEHVKTAILHLICMWGLDPDNSGLGFLAPLYLNRMLNVMIMKGGSHRLGSALHKAFMVNGGEVLEAAEVVKIVTTGGAAHGVELNTGQKFEARAILTTTDPQTTFLKLVGEDVCNNSWPTLADAAKQWEWESYSLFGIHLALSERPVYKAVEKYPEVDDALIKIIGYESSGDFLSHLKSIKEGKLVVAGHTSTMSDIDPQQAPGDVTPGAASVRWESLAPYKPKDGSWSEKAEPYADALMQLWREYAPNLAKAKMIRRYVYPPTFIEEKLVNMIKGSFKHGAYIPTQMGNFRPNFECSNYSTPIKGLYVGGASTYPGGMVLGGGGYNAAGVVVDDLGLKRWWAEPDIVKKAREKKLVPPL
ncbi:MAG: NAD(P)/FAD-dependent oxidoreductase [Dehalococcoidia bacterium]|jgi:phytoene dehydrogenase-like protein